MPPGWRVAMIAAPAEMLDRLRADVDVAAAALGIEAFAIRYPLAGTGETGRPVARAC